MAKKKKAPQLEAWCWYCDREFEDEKVLLQHQKAKHYRCPHCPRRLNTAGGLTVHLAQVHKAEPTKIENALPGRESFDVEIYGMVGIPEADLAEWRSRRGQSGAGGGGAGANGQPASKRPRIEKVVLTPEQLKAQLEAHKALMSGQAPPPGAVPGTFSQAPPPLPPVAYSGPPPAFPGQFTGPPPFGPPPGVPPPGFGPPPGFPNMPPPGFPVGPPPGFGGASTSALSGPPPFVPQQQPSPHQQAVRSGAKSRMVYTDTALSPEEKLASTSKYAYYDHEDAAARVQATAAAAYAQRQPPPQLQPQPSSSSAPSSAYVTPHNSSSDPVQPASAAQSYPAIAPGAEPASANPEANTAEALAAANESTATGSREADAQHMAEAASDEASASAQNGGTLDEDVKGVTEAAGGATGGGGGLKRARAADLF